MAGYLPWSAVSSNLALSRGEGAGPRSGPYRAGSGSAISARTRASIGSRAAVAVGLRA